MSDLSRPAMDQTGRVDSIVADVDITNRLAGESPGHSTATTPRLRSSRLLNLPAELPNQIYRHTLTSDIPTRVNSTYRPPALIHIDQQIRHEAGSIYYLENHFSIFCPDFSDHHILKFCNDMWAMPSIWKPSVTPKITLCVHRQSLVRKNIVRWIEQWYHSAAPAIGKNAAELGPMAVTRAFHVLEPLKGSVPWEKAQKVMDEYFVAAKEQANGAWDWS